MKSRVSSPKDSHSLRAHIWDVGCTPSNVSVRSAILTVRERERFVEECESGRGLVRWPSIMALYGSRAHHSRMIAELGSGTDIFMMRILLDWCDRNGALINPSVLPRRKQGKDASVFRDYAWFVERDVPAFTPLLAIPERLCVGFKDTNSAEDLCALKRGITEAACTSVDETAKEAGVSTEDKPNYDANESSDSDMCAFFFTALGLLVNDLLVATNNGLSDPRYGLARALQRTRTAHNAPYLEPISFGPPETCLAEVFRQMVHNYISAGPLTGKVEKDMLEWAVSISLSHSTPLTIAGRRSIGVVPLVHLMPHGADRVNAVLVTRRGPNDGAMLQRFFADVAPYMTGAVDDAMIYLVATRDLDRGEEIATQAMAPVCNRTEEAEYMWRLTCGEAPPDGSVKSSEYQSLQNQVNREILKRGSVCN